MPSESTPAEAGMPEELFEPCEPPTYSTCSHHRGAHQPVGTPLAQGCGFLAGVKVRPEAVPSHLRACRRRRRGEPSMSIYPPSSSMSLGSREVQTQCRRSEEHVGRMPSAPPSTHGPSGVGRTGHEPPSTVERDRKAASPLGLVRSLQLSRNRPAGLEAGLPVPPPWGRWEPEATRRARPQRGIEPTQSIIGAGCTKVNP